MAVLEHDAWLALEVSERIERRLAHSDRVVLQGAGHFSMEDKPSEVADALGDWMGRG